MSTLSQRGIWSRVPDVLIDDNRVIFLEAILVLVVVWSVVANQFGLVDTISSPWLVAQDTLELLLSRTWIEHVGATLRRTVYGFVVTITVGTILGMAMGWSPFWGDALKDYVIIGLALPSLFAVVFSAMWFGTSDVTPVLAAAAISFPFVTQGIYEGVRDIDSDLLEMSSSFGVSAPRVVWRVVTQSILPEWFAGARYAFAVCWKITTLAEFLVGTDGIGFMIGFELDSLSITGVLSWTFLFILIIVLVEYGLFQQLEKRVFDWRESDEITWA